MDKEPEEGSEKQQDVQANSSKNDVKNLSDYNQKGESDGTPIPDKADQHPITATKSEEKGTTKTENKSEVVDKSDKKSVSSEEKNGKGKIKARTYADPPGTCNADTCGGSFDFTHDILTLVCYATLTYTFNNKIHLVLSCFSNSQICCQLQLTESLDKCNF